jgi:hypothetical protein
MDGFNSALFMTLFAHYLGREHLRFGQKCDAARYYQTLGYFKDWLSLHSKYAISDFYLNIMCHFLLAYFFRILLYNSSLSNSSTSLPPTWLLIKPAPNNNCFLFLILLQRNLSGIKLYIIQALHLVNLLLSSNLFLFLYFHF